jgi:hypothetical protein
MSPEFPIRVIMDDGECELIPSPEDLMQRVDSLDSTDPAGRVWVRDAYDRTVLIRMRGGTLEVFGVAP